MKLQRYSYFCTDGKHLPDDDGDVLLVSDVLPLLSRYDKLVEAAEQVLAIHAGHGENVPASIKELRAIIRELY